ncbi:MAG: peptidoglycan DD-metalloendopeptidase family protein [Chloroflexia bacterium]
MLSASPSKRGSEGIRPIIRLSARARLQEAVWEARTSLEQVSGLPTPVRPRRWLIWLSAVAEQLAQRLCLQQLRRRAAFPARWLRSAHRFAGHLCLLGLLGALLLGGGFQGAFAQPVENNQGGIALAWQRIVGEGQDLTAAYASIPAVPVLIQRVRPAAEAITIDEQVVASARKEVIVYTVQSGDSLSAIAERFGLSVETLYWFNELKSADLLSVGQELKIPPVDGLIHEVKEGETLDSIAEKYGVRKGNMIAYAANNLREPYTLQVGQKIFVPGASKPIPRPTVTAKGRPSYIRLTAPPYAALPGGERFSWPVIGRITERFGWTGSRWHTGLDIATSWGTPIYSAAAGTVTYAGWRGTLGYMVEIDHGEGWITRYGHMAQQPDVSVGQWVERGQLIGYIGCTGKCTGPHLHFEVLYQGAYTDPLDYLQ